VAWNQVDVVVGQGLGEDAHWTGSLNAIRNYTPFAGNAGARVRQAPAPAVA
jgi:hypothetical protein